LVAVGVLASVAPVIASGGLPAAAAAVSTPGGFASLAPARLLDTRSGVGAGKAAVAAGGTVRLQVAGRGGVPVSGVSAVVLNVTVTAPTSAGYVTVYGDGTARPGASNLNFVKAQTVPNLVIAPLGVNGKVDLYNGSGGSVQIVADVSGYTLSDSTSPSPSPSPSPWVPAVGGGWQIQYTGTLDTSFDVPTYDLDGFDTTASTVTTLRAAGHHAICYISAGSWEDWRPDAASYPSSVLGSSNGWPGERWVDIRQISALKPIMDSRLDMCRSKGFEAVDPDNVDGYTNNSGFPLTAADQLAFNRWMAAEAHTYGLSVGLKNDLDQVPDLVGSYDFAVNEQCYQYKECAALNPFISAGKAVLQIEYKGDPSQICPISLGSGFSTLFKNLSLDAWRQAC
jgi:hypothetical protein